MPRKKLRLVTETENIGRLRFAACLFSASFCVAQYFIRLKLIEIDFRSPTSQTCFVNTIFGGRCFSRTWTKGDPGRNIQTSINALQQRASDCLAQILENYSNTLNLAFQPEENTMQHNLYFIEGPN